MRHKKKKQAMDAIVLLMVDIHAEERLNQLREIAIFIKEMRNSQPYLQGNSQAYNVLQSRVDWLYGYEENELFELIDGLKERVEKRILDNDSSYTCILSSITCHVLILKMLQDSPCDLFSEDFNIWEGYVLPDGNQRALECFDILKKYCPQRITPECYTEAKKYIRIWDSDFFW